MASEISTEGSSAPNTCITRSLRCKCPSQVGKWRLLLCACAVLYLSLDPAAAATMVRRDLNNGSDTQSADYRRIVQQMSASGAKSLTQETLTNPNCYVEIYEPRRVGGKCGTVRGGITYCAVGGFFYMNNFDGCEEMPTGG